MTHSFSDYKGNISERFAPGSLLSDGIKCHGLDQTIIDTIDSPGQCTFIELSRFFSPVWNSILPRFSSGSFISHDSFHALLVHHCASMQKITNLTVWHTGFTIHDLQAGHFSETTDLIYSLSGLSWKDIYTLLPGILSMLKVNGILYLEFPAYWFFRDKLDSDEQAVLNWSKQNDKQWLFTEPVEPIIEENGAAIISFEATDTTNTYSRIELAQLSSLHKLANADREKNIAITETCNIPEEGLSIRIGRLVIKKAKMTLTKDNLFSD